MRVFPTHLSVTQFSTGAPLTTLGSRPAHSSIHPAIPVTVLLPDVPAIATHRCDCTRRARISDRCTTGTPNDLAATRSGLSDSIAVLTTTATSFPLRPVPSCGVKRMPHPASFFKMPRSCPESRWRSDPDTSPPCPNTAWATALIPTPATPTK